MTKSPAIIKLGKILRTDQDFLIKIDERLSAITGRKRVLEKIAEENSKEIRDRLLILGASSQANANEVYDALISKIEADDYALSQALNRPVCHSQEGCSAVLSAAAGVRNGAKGFFLKKEKAEELIRRNPPKRVMAYLGYDSAEAMLVKEDLLEVWSALRFVEGSEWLNSVFFKEYEGLKADDFEEREIETKALGEKWSKAAEKFVFKKWHNISHLKELGVVFVIPVSLGISGELLRMISLIFHYLHEVPFYSDMFRRIAEVPETFSENLVSLLRGDIVERRMAEGDKTLWLVMQRYLAKEDENDWRLFVPRINPEALHWLKAEEDLVKLGSRLNGLNSDLKFWHNLDWVGDYFRDEAGSDVLVSFNLVDTVMSLVKQKELIKYLYHHQEALWNKIFMEYFGQEELEKFAKDYLLQGYFEI